jgi:hypothetical protein
VWRETNRPYTAAVATLLYAIYPAFVYSQAIWLTNQMHLLASLVVLVALLVWQRACRVGRSAWWWLLVLQLVAFGLKEDTIMLLPLVFALTWLRRWMRGDIRMPPVSVLLAGAVLLLALPYWRYVALGRHLGGYGMPTFDKGLNNLAKGLGVFLQRPAKRPWQGVANWYSLACLGLGTLAGAFRRNSTSLYVIGSGVFIFACFNLPFYLVAKGEQVHLLGLGCVVVLAGSLDALHTAWTAKPLRQAVGAAGAVAALCFLPVTRSIATDFAPCNPNTLYTDDIALGWWVVPYEIKEWLRQKPATCKAGASLVPLNQALPTVTWALSREIDETGTPVHWTADRALVLLRPSASRANVMVRSPAASKDTPTTVVLDSDGGTVRVEDDRWHTQTVCSRVRSDAAVRHASPGNRVNPVFIPTSVS